MGSAEQSRLTQAVLEGLTCPPGRKDRVVFDGEVRGFAVRITEAGSKVFLVQYTSAGAKRRVSIGRFGTLTVTEARREARALLGAVARGDDPFAARKAATIAAHAAKAELAYTFAQMVREWAKARSADRRPAYLKEATSCLTRNLPQWQDRPAGSITFAEAIAALDSIKASKGIVSANRTAAYASAAFGWTVRRQRLTLNPLRGIERPGREEPRERVLHAGELADIWRGCDSLSPPALAGFVRCLMLTLQRRQEVASMRWEELNDPADPTVWSLPSERTKNCRSHVVHLSPLARAIVRSMLKIHGSPYVFAGLNGNPVGAFSYAKAQIDKAVPGMADWRLHDFRRSGVTVLANTDFSPHVCDRLLNHVGGSLSAIARVYQRSEFHKERKAALEAWAAYVLDAVEKKSLALAQAA
jgi:integrase